MPDTIIDEPRRDSVADLEARVETIAVRREDFERLKSDHSRVLAELNSANQRIPTLERDNADLSMRLKSAEGARDAAQSRRDYVPTDSQLQRDFWQGLKRMTEGKGTKALLEKAVEMINAINENLQARGKTYQADLDAYLKAKGKDFTEFLDNEAKARAEAKET